MKKTISIVLITLLLIFSTSIVYATTSFTVALSASSTKVEKGKDVEVTIGLKNFTAGETGINAIHLTIDYDKSVFETLETADLTSASGWSSPVFNPANGQLALDNSSFMAENHDMLKIKFTVKDTANVGNTVITVKDVNGSDAVSDIYPSEQKITLTIQEKQEQPVKNEVKNEIKVENEVKNEAENNPTTGFEDYTVPAILIISILAIVAYVKYKNLEK